MDVIALMETSRAVRHFKPDAVPREMVERLIYAATRAPSPMNSQTWNFIVVTGSSQRQRIADAFEAFSSKLDDAMRDRIVDNSELRRTTEGVRHLISNLHEVPVLIIVTGGLAYPPERPRERYTYSAMYTASENILLAARGFGLGAAFTTLHDVIGPRLREILKIPDDQIIGAVIPVGWPERPFGPVKRRPVAEVIHYDIWNGNDIA